MIALGECSSGFIPKEDQLPANNIVLMIGCCAGHLPANNIVRDDQQAATHTQSTWAASCIPHSRPWSTCNM